ncbi:MAG TPA: xanthine dehydrogenase family protein molybdopterin-binding subunit, partial [Candidatus Limnocylindria bacterium]|nr:xanthine dehydrogenase family protein molybdopterin-binding subunit [Candidatus Limnocylindria bacterium]
SDRDARRTEDGPLLTGRGRFTDDVNVPGQAHAAFVRAQVGHAELRGVDPSRALTMPGVLAVFTGRDLAADGLGALPPAVLLPGRGGRPMFCAAMPPLAIDRVRYAGEPVAIVVAETAAQARDAAEAVVIDATERPAVSDVERALAPGAPVLWPEAPGNVALDWTDGDAAAVQAACARAAHVERVRLLDPRLAPAALEPRAAIGRWDAASGRYTLTAGTQGVAIVRRMLAEHVFKVPVTQLRVLTYDVGGGFGMKTQAYGEYAALLYAARRVGRPVRWCATRLESFLADTAGRDGVLEGELALDGAGRILAVRMRARVGMGAYTSTFSGIFATNNTKNCLSSVYAIPALQIDVQMALTNAAPLGPYRGAGRPEALYVVERLLDGAARSMGIDRVELRRRNLIPPAAMPYRAANGQVYDSGEFEAVMDKALALADWKGFADRRAASERAGRLRGIGLACFLEVAGGILDETVDMRFEADGTVALRTGVQAMGQGHLSTYPRLVAARLGVDPGAVRLIEGDSDEVPAGTPSVASRSLMMAGSATALACDAAIDKGRQLAARLFEAAPFDVEFTEGRFHVKGTDRAIGILDLARRADVAGALDSTATFVSPHMSFPNGCHVTEVEIDPDTGAVRVVGYAAVDDVGRVAHPVIVEGQIHGGVAQGLGQVLGEQVVYDEAGQLLTASFMEYMLPRAEDVPDLRVGHHEVPCTTNPLGVKGAGESGVAGSLPSAVNAVLDALASRGITHLDLPMTPARVWAALAHGGPEKTSSQSR